MMSASALSAQIRAKKKKMEAEHSDAVKLSGIPQDATDIEVTKGMEAGERLSENTPKERDEDPGLAAQIASDSSNGEAPMTEAPDPKQINQPADGERENRKAKIKARMRKGA